MVFIIVGALWGIAPLRLPQGDAQSWCQHLPTRHSPLQEFGGIKIEYVNIGRLSAATRMLSKRTIIRLRANMWSMLTGKHDSQRNGDFVYLVRAGFMAPEGLSGTALGVEGQKPWYTVYHDGDDASVRIVSALTAYHVNQVPTGYPLILIAPGPIRRVSVTCMGGD